MPFMVTPGRMRPAYATWLPMKSTKMRNAAPASPMSKAESRAEGRETGEFEFLVLIIKWIITLQIFPGRRGYFTDEKVARKVPAMNFQIGWKLPLTENL